jgi:hypothetical protein
MEKIECSLITAMEIMNENYALYTLERDMTNYTWYHNGVGLGSYNEYTKEFVYREV